ncbi:MAG: histidine phosphatase family protein [Burkholderiaceae bacterium]|nr:histidine phosphatase family protein [Burkholderiaceae bacterium]MCX7901026.1 histidine phosphatase family protein [Burkholderiaceae bacterium]
MIEVELHLWRHPRIAGADGLCLGALDWPVDARRARHLARHIAAQARALRLPPAIATSPLLRCRAVAAHLHALKWRVTVDARLTELNFGRWQGKPWREVPAAEIAAWEADFLHHRPGGGESLAQLRARLAAYVQDVAQGVRPVLAITHAGCIAALATLCQPLPTASAWPRAPACGSYTRLRLEGAFPGA